jgi:hypothetical protein
MFNKVILIGRLGQNAEAKIAQNNKEYVIRSIAKQIIHGREIEVEFARPFRLELSRLQLDHEIAVQPKMIKKEVNVEGLASDLERYLAADEGKPAAKLQKKIAKMFEEPTLKLPLFSG